MPSNFMNRNFFSLLFASLILIIFPQAYAEYEDTIVVLETNSGRLILEFFPDVAPNHVKNFVTLSENGFYTETAFHRIIEGFMIQGGDPNTKDPTKPRSVWGTGDPGYTVDEEFNQIKHTRGILSMARSSDPDSAGSQFFIVHKDSNFLDGQYTVFGRIITEESFQTLDKIATVDTWENDQPEPQEKENVTITNVEILERSELENLPKFVMPEKSELDVEKITKEIEASNVPQRNEFREYGISFTSPAGWLVQTPPALTPTSPDIVAVGPKTSDSNPAVSFKITRQNSSLESAIEGLRNMVSPMIETGALTVTNENFSQIQGHDAYVLNAVGHFENKDEIETKVGFSTVIVKTDKDMFYYIQYSNDLSSFQEQSELFDLIINSVEFSNIEHAKVPVGGNPISEENSEKITQNENESEGGGCLIATAAFGSEIAPQIQQLRELRDNVVMQTNSGKSFMTGFNQIYYSFSPGVADYERENPLFKEAVKVSLTPLLTSLTLLNYVDVDSEQEILGYGIGIILLNIAMYFVAPAAVIIAIKNRIK